MPWRSAGHNFWVKVNLWTIFFHLGTLLYLPCPPKKKLMALPLYLIIYYITKRVLIIYLYKRNLYDHWWDQQAFKDLLHVLVRPITTTRSKKNKEALNWLIQEIWTDSNTGHSKLGPKEDEGIINLTSEEWIHVTISTSPVHWMH